VHIFGLCDTEVPEFSQSRVISEMSFVPAGVPCLPRSLISLLIPSKEHLISHQVGNAVQAVFRPDNLCSLNLFWVFA